VEDNPHDAELMLHTLRAYGYEPHAETVASEASFIGKIGAHLDVILCDHAMPSFSPRHALEILRSRSLNVPMIVVTGTITDEGALELLREGAEDYVLKDRLLRLGPAVSAAVGRTCVEQRYRATFDHAAVGIAHVAANGTLVDVNRRICGALGCEPGDLIGRPVLDFVHSADRDSARALLRPLETGEAVHDVTCEVRLVGTGRRIMWANVAAAVVRPGNAPPYLVAMIQDVSERKHAQTRAALLQATTIAISESHDLHTALRLVIARICELTGWPYAQAWLPNATQTALECSVAWHDGSPALEQFHQSSRAISLTEAEPTPAASAYLSGEPRLIGDLTCAAECLRGEAALAQCFTACVAIPVVAESRPVALLEFFLPGVDEDDAERVDTIAVVARQLGMLFERKAARERLAYVAHHDALTGLPNRALFNDRLQHTLAQAQRNDRTVAILLLDVDRFAAVNELVGYSAGDKVLQNVAAKLAKCTRAGDTIARLGGDEFAIILSEIGEANDAAFVAQKMLSLFAEPIEIGAENVYATASIGIALYPGDGTTAHELIKDANAALQRAKATGRGKYEFFTAHMNAQAFERIQLEHRLRGALRRDEFLLVYQPKLETRTGRVVGVEALLRWQPCGTALVAPDRFIPVLEDTGLIVEVGEWALRAACGQVRSWLDAGIDAVPVAVNVSAKQLDGSFAQLVSRTLGEYGLAPQWLELEITESAVMKNPTEATRVLEEIRALGVRISMDDFGTGYSSLGYLRRLPVHAIKIDRGFVTEIASSPGDAAIAQSIIELAHRLGLEVIAEGVETAEQLSVLASAGCDQMQGYLFARPLVSGKVTELLKSPRDLGAWAARDDRAGGAA
jgi:diguanylate cyclase (GGDEF)-like protein/PAS domain S-box-containing protein